MSTDRELLELAAKAAGLELLFWNVNGFMLADGCSHWNPLTDDGDALRLAVKLGIGILQWGDQAQTHHYFNAAANGISEPAGFANGMPGAVWSRPEATRRAIVRAAAELGRAM